MYFIKDLFTISVNDVDDFEAKWLGFKNKCWTLCMCYDDFTIDEILGVIKFLKPYVYADPKFQELNKKYDKSCGQQLMELRDKLRVEKKKKDKEAFDIAMKRVIDKQTQPITDTSISIGSMLDIPSHNSIATDRLKLSIMLAGCIPKPKTPFIIWDDHTERPDAYLNRNVDAIRKYEYVADFELHESTARLYGGISALNQNVWIDSIPRPSTKWTTLETDEQMNLNTGISLPELPSANDVRYTWCFQKYVLGNISKRDLLKIPRFELRLSESFMKGNNVIMQVCKKRKPSWLDLAK